MKIKLASGTAQAAQDALSLHGGALYSTLGSHRVGIVELASIERTEIAPDEEKSPQVTLQVKQLEIATGDAEDAVRRALDALYTQRTAYGTLTEDHDVELSQNVLEACAGNLNAIAAARLHVVVDEMGAYARNIARSNRATANDLRQALTKVAETLTKAAAGVQEELPV